jgi:4'-phosphopantetheinyl transferase
MAAGPGHHDTARLWLIRTDLPDDVLSRLAALLDEHERQRLDAIRDDISRRRFTAAHGVTRLVVGHHSGAPPEAVRWRRGVHGKPELAWPRGPLHVNLSHSGGLALVAVSAHRPVGVDVEAVSRSVAAGRLAARYYPGVEADLVARAGGPADQLDRVHPPVGAEGGLRQGGRGAAVAGAAPAGGGYRCHGASPRPR